MSRNLLSALGIGMVAMLIMAIMVFGVGVALNCLLLGGIDNIYNGLIEPGEEVLILTGIAKVVCSGPAALLAIWAIQGCLKVIDRLRAWRVGHG